MRILAPLLSLCVATAGSAAQAAFITPSSATASSTFSGSYDISNTIDGSGLPGAFTTSSAHADYAANNHWTTQRFASNSALIAAQPTATFFFDTAQDLGELHLWNHRSNIIADDPNYAVRTFDLTFRDGSNNVLSTLTGLSALQNVATAQTYALGAVYGVRSVEFKVIDNFGSRLTGFAEIRFGGVAAVPEPGSISLLAAALPLLAGSAWLRRRKSAVG